MTAVTIITMSSIQCGVSTRSLAAPLPKCRRRRRPRRFRPNGHASSPMPPLIFGASAAVAAARAPLPSAREDLLRPRPPPPSVARSVGRSVGRTVGWELGAAKAAAAALPPATIGGSPTSTLANITRFSEHDNDFRWDSNILTYSALSLLSRAMRGV